VTVQEIFEQNKEKDIYFFGSGGVFDSFLELNRDLVAMENIKGILDNDEKKWGTVKAGLPIQNPNELEGKTPQKIFVFITSSFVQEIKSQLKGYGIQNAISKQEVCYIGRMYRDEEVKILQDMKQLLADEKSREIIDFIIERRKSGNPNFTAIYEEKQYLVENMVSLTDHEVIVDGGAFIGDTAACFIKATKNQFMSIYSFEPDDNNYKKLCESFGEDKRLHAIHAGLGKEHMEMGFVIDENNAEGGRLSEQSEDKMIVECIDDVIKEPVTFIKLDVEGFEMDTLIGASKTIQKYKPTLAICVYHKAEDLYELPLYIHKLVPEYKLYLRHHSAGVAETVLYAVM
jgi:FkbM family methyltransferase